MQKGACFGFCPDNPLLFNHTEQIRKRGICADSDNTIDGVQNRKKKQCVLNKQHAQSKAEKKLTGGAAGWAEPVVGRPTDTL
jgi:hypothetical protein